MTFVISHDALSWGRIVRAPHHVASPRFRDELPGMLSGRPAGPVLAVGLQRSYGDSVVNSGGSLIAMPHLDRFMTVDRDTGVVRAEAGLTLGALMRHVVPMGWFVPVTPGTRFVTLGGAVANDVHGKNHHAGGTFGRHVLALGLMRSSGESLVVSAQDNTGLFAATVGGLGLTGIIEWVELKLQPIQSAMLDVETIPYANLAEFWHIAEQSAASHEHTVAWIDCAADGANAGRGIFSRANWSASGGLVPHEDGQRLGVPVDAPAGLLNRTTIKLFNRAYYAAQKRKAGQHRQHYSQYFHPLDAIAGWNRLYGRKGFWQYQCVVPTATMKDAIAALLQAIAAAGQGSFLAVLKTCGGLASPGLLSFPMEGATLALDFPNQGEKTLALLSRLDAIVRQAGGRLYAAKDGRIPKDMWHMGYPALDRFAAFVDPAFGSDFWRRVA